jgi:hypothetical protein
LAERHPVVKAFRAKRGQLTRGQEAVQGLQAPIVAYSLHAGAYRGLTWYYETQGVVWLLAARFHRSGSRDDAYPFFRSLPREALLPTSGDVRAYVERQVRTFAQVLLVEPQELRALAEGSPGEVVEGFIGGRIPVRVSYEPDSPPMLTVAISRYIQPGDVQMPGDWLVQLAAAFFPRARLDELSTTDDIAGQPLRRDETAFCDFSDEPDEYGDVDAY